MRNESGFSIVEVLLALLLAAGAMATILALVNPSRAIFSAQTETSDSQQRLRVATGALHREISMAGGGPLRGARAGPLTAFLAPVLPYRADPNGDPPGSFRTDVMTVIYVPAGGAEGTTAAPVPARSGSAALDTAIGCPPTGLLCGFGAGMNVLVYDDSGVFDVFTVGGSSGSSLHLQHTTADSAHVYPSGSRIAQVLSRTYFLKTNPTTNVDQLMRADGDGGPDVPVVDHVVGLSFEYYGDPQPPVVHGAVIDPATAWTTYGPKPSLPGVQAQPTTFPPGENCIFANDGSAIPAPRLSVLGAADTLVRLAPAQLTDGPWCPDAFHPARFDADLLRIRRVAVTLRIQSALATVRGPASFAFRRAGTAQGALQLAPDLEARLQVTPRNASLRR